MSFEPALAPLAYAAELQAFGQRLARIRKRRHLSQAKLAEVVGLDRPFLGALERGHKNPSLVTLMRLSLALDTELAELVPTLNAIRDSLITHGSDLLDGEGSPTIQ